MPYEDAADQLWEDWGALQEIQTTLAGYASTLLAGGDTGDLAMLAEARRLLERPGVRALIGDRLADFLKLMDLIAHASAGRRLRLASARRRRAPTSRGRSGGADG